MFRLEKNEMNNTKTPKHNKCHPYEFKFEEETQAYKGIVIRR